jgi:uncharacterized damage-inducible protein DinB
VKLDELFIDFSADKLKQLASRIQDCLSRLSTEQVWQRCGEHDNSIGNLVLHLCGNVNQWIGTGVAGQPNIRDRDAEFAARGGQAPEELTEKLVLTVADALRILRDVTAERLAEIVVIQDYRVSVLEAIYHVVEHFAQHTGQIMFATKLMLDVDLGYYRHLSAAAGNAAVPAGDATP